MKKCKSCGAEILFTIQSNGLKKYDHKYGYGIKCGCYSEWLLTTPEGRELMNKATLKATKPRRELEKEKASREDRKKLGTLIQDTQRLFNKYIRLRDKGKPCISSGIPYKSDFEAGHCFPVSTYPGLRFDFDNVHGQSVKDNRFKDGAQEDYLINLYRRIGKERTEALIERAKDYKKNGHRFTREYLKELQSDLKQKIKELNQ